MGGSLSNNVARRRVEQSLSVAGRRRRQGAAGQVRQVELIETVAKQVAETLHIGPLPDPDTLAKYDEVVPGTARSIVEAFTSQGKHRQALERKIVEGSETRATRGQWLVFSLLLMCVAGGLGVAFALSPVAGCALAGSAVGGGALLYIFGGDDRVPRPKAKPAAPPSEAG